jgi:glycosyltransferase involved in cell wall biosynthesis
VTGAAGLRILAFCDYFSERSSGGSERAALELYRRLVTQGATIRVITSLPTSMPPVASDGRLQVQVVPSLDLTRRLGIQAALAPSLFRGLGKLVADFRPNVLHANTLFFSGSLAAALLQRKTGLPLVTTVQIAGLDLLPWTARLAGSAYERTVGRFILSRSAGVIAVSASVKAHVQRLGAKVERVVVIPNGVDLERFHPDGARAENAAATIVFVGRLIANKGPQMLVEALRQLEPPPGTPQTLASHVPRGSRGPAGPPSPRGGGINPAASDFRVVFIGDGPIRPQLERDTAFLGDAVEFTGQLPDVSARLRQADIVVRPSLTEGLPLGILEAMASGVCVVATDIPGNRDLIRDGENGLLVPPKDAISLANAIRSLVPDPARRRRLAAAGVNTARQYGWDSIAVRTVKVLTDVAEASPVALRAA